MESSFQKIHTGLAEEVALSICMKAAYGHSNCQVASRSPCPKRQWSTSSHLLPFSGHSSVVGTMDPTSVVAVYKLHRRQPDK
jgi:hypothetical protein